MTVDKRGSGGRIHKVSLDLDGVLAELDELAESLDPGPRQTEPPGDEPDADLVVELDEPAPVAAKSDEDELLEELRRDRQAEERRREEAALSDALRQERLRADGLASEIEVHKQRFSKATGDFEAYKRSLLKEKEENAKFGNERIIKDILPSLDNLQRAIDHAGDDSGSQLVDGIRMVHRQMMQTLGRFGLEPFESTGQPFDPRRHQAMSQVEHASLPSGSVVDEVQRGYFLHGRLLRPALVTVSRGSPEEAPASEQTEVPDEPKGFDTP